MTPQPQPPVRIGGLNVRLGRGEPSLSLGAWRHLVPLSVLGVHLRSIHGRVSWRAVPLAEPGSPGAPPPPATDADLLDALADRARRAPHWPLLAALCALVALAYTRAVQHPPQLSAWLAWFAVSAAAVAAQAWRDGLHRHTVFFYELDPHRSDAHTALVAGVRQAAGSLRLYTVAAAEHPAPDGPPLRGVPLVRYPRMVARRMRLALGHPPGIRANLAVPVVRCQARWLAFLPDRLLEWHHGELLAIPYRQLQIHRSVLGLSVARDASPHPQAPTAQSEPKSPSLPVRPYDLLVLGGPSGWSLKLLASREDAWQGVEAALSRLCALDQSGFAPPASPPRSAS